MRLVARDSQLKNIFDPDTYADTVRTDNLPLFLIIFPEKDVDMASHDVKMFFLYSSLKSDKKVYLRRPKGATDDLMPQFFNSTNVFTGFPKHQNIRHSSLY